MTSATADRELVLSRVFDAPRDLVFKLWTDSRHVAQWYGPPGFTVTVQEMDVRPGGVWRFVMHAPNGVDYPNLVEFLDVVEPERLVFMHSSGEPGDHGFRTVLSLLDQAGKTRLTLRQLFATAAERDYAAREINAVEMGNQTLGKLAAHLAKIAA
jgi:uncharacterized protein YndB with AHSA1/START domain